MDKDADKTDTWAEDQEKRDYYYDDSHGYEIYNPDEDDEDEDEENAKRENDNERTSKN